MVKIKAALLIDGTKVARWQKKALEASSELLSVEYVLSSQGSKRKRRLGAHFLYYVLNFFTLRNSMSKRIDMRLPGVKIIEFVAEQDGVWQELPEHVVNRLKQREIKVVVKFGMSLLRVPKSLEAIKILSFHHGDPRFYRGRPAGFYEILHNEKYVGIIVQEIGNSIDQGKVWSFARSRVSRHSYRTTATTFFQNSETLLRKALENIQLNNPQLDEPSGKLTTLPPNSMVVRFMLLLLGQKSVRLARALFIEKRWRVGLLPSMLDLGSETIDLGQAEVLEAPRGYSFIADPFFSASGDRIRVEAMKSKTGKGDILAIDLHTLKVSSRLLGGKHYSYPFSISARGKEFIFPEVASHSAPSLFEVSDGSLTKLPLSGLEGLRIIDGTLLQHCGVSYLFCGLEGSALDNLRLYYSDDLIGRYREHPMSPIVVDPTRARMGGSIFHAPGGLFRFGQDNSGEYGDGVTICQILTLDKEKYSEELLGTLRVSGMRGPHTVNINFGRTIFDFYTNSFSLLAGYRRIASRLSLGTKQEFGTKRFREPTM